MSSAGDLEPLYLREDAETGDLLLIYRTNKAPQVELRVSDGTFWATETQMATMFGVTRQNINLHLQNVYNEGELDRAATCKETLRVAQEGSRQVRRPVLSYDLNAVISVGYRVGSIQGTLFRIWATDKLFQYLTKGFVIDKERLKDPEDYGRIQELRRIIAEIRASDVNFYGELRQICAMAKDYDSKSPAWHSFYKQMRAKLYWAVVSKTPSMIMAERADAEAPNMGLQSWAGDRILQKDATSAVRYLAEAEFRELNSLTVILLDVFSDQADMGKLTSMKQAEELFGKQLTLLNRSVLRHGGSIASEEAEDHAKAEYKKFDTKRKAESIGIEVQAYLELKATGKALPKPKKKKVDSASQKA